ncbi:unnamed protein product [Adineta steineri]|uniref:C2 domain-containing protein n=2 Tax=Adineta steineri TaxID=433720 RepID=A0A815ULP8_9BILA|nr:unnamed protein product [Adineta steineri]
MAQLQVTVVEAKNLTKKDTLSQNDPFVEIYLDNKHLKQKTKTKQNSKTPQWNQTFVFNHLTGQDILNVDVYDEDSVKDEKIGSIQINLHDLYKKGFVRIIIKIKDGYFSFFLGHIDEWFELEGKNNSTSDGQIHLILDYERLRI